MRSRLIAISFTLGSAALMALIGTSVVGCGSDTKSSSSGGQVQQGQLAVTQFSCTSCHGGNLAGMTVAMSGAYPANITPDPDTGIGGWDEATIVKAILTGLDDENQPLCLMPKFGDPKYGMTQDQANAIAAYLKTIPAVSNKIPDSTCAGKM